MEVDGVETKVHMEESGDENDEKNSDSDSDSDSEEALDQLEKEVSEKPSEEGYRQLLRALRSQGELVRLRAAREAFCAHFPLEESEWEEWLQDEFNLGSVNETQLNKVLDRAERECESVSLWQIKLNKLIEVSQRKTPDQAAVRTTFIQASEVCGCNFTDGHRLLDMWIKYEESNNNPASLEKALLFAIAAPVRGLEHDSLLDKLKQMNSTLSPLAEALCQRSQELVNAFEPLENELIAHVAGNDKQRMALWKKYISSASSILSKSLKQKLPGDPFRQVFVLRTLHKRMVRALPREPQSWSLLLHFALHTATDESFFIRTAERAVRFCADDPFLWKQQLQALEHKTLEFEELVQQVGLTIQRAVQSKFPSFEDYATILLASCDLYRRYLIQREDGFPEGRQHILAHYEYAVHVVKTIASNSAGALIKVLRAYSDCLSDEDLFPGCTHSADTLQKILDLWEQAMDLFPENLQVYQQAAQVFGGLRELALVRKVMSRGIHRFRSGASNAPQKLVAARKLSARWLEWESRFGNLASLEQAQRKVAMLLMEERDEDGEEESEANKKRKRKSDSQKKERAKKTQSKHVDEADEQEVAKGKKRKAQEMEDEQLQEKKKEEEKDEAKKPNNVVHSGEHEKKRSKSSRDKATMAQPEEQDKQVPKQQRSIFVTNLSYQATEAQIHEHFDSLESPVVSVQIKRNKANKPKGSAVVLFKTQQGAVAAMEQKNGTLLLGRAVEVSEYKKGGEVVSSTEGKLGVVRDANSARRSVYIGKIPAELCSEEEICGGSGQFFQALRSCGELDAVKVARNKTSAVVRFQDADATHKALALDGKEFEWSLPSGDVKRASVVVSTVKTPYSARSHPSSLVPRSILRNQVKKKKIAEVDDSSHHQRTETAPSGSAGEQKAAGMKSNDYFASLFKKA